MREAKKRAKEEYRQRLIQGKADAMMRHARESADEELASKEQFRRSFPKNFKMFLAMAAGLLIAIALSK
ncbi:MAG: hypothetical protein HQL44_08735 [Alphaproteobacteria bacterium]|nr:hypothetical protein [Alphaproteobacteria bacterium]